MRLDLVVGPNGAGKSTFVDLVLADQLPGTPFVNANVIAAQRWPSDAEARAYEAAQIAAATRAALLNARLAFIAETVFSHPSKLDLIRQAKAAGYLVVLHVVVVPAEVSVARVARRVLAGGQSVPEAKIRARYDRLWVLVAEAISLTDAAVIYDNSSDGRPEVIASFRTGFVDAAPTWPDWTPTALRVLTEDSPPRDGERRR